MLIILPILILLAIYTAINRKDPTEQWEDRVVDYNGEPWFFIKAKDCYNVIIKHRDREEIRTILMREFWLWDEAKEKAYQEKIHKS